MTKEQLIYSLETKELKLSFWDKLTHYGIVLFLFFIPSVFIFLRLKDYFNGTPKAFKNAELWFMIIPTLLGLLFYKFQKKRLKFKSIKTELTREELDPIIEQVANELKWTPYIVNKKMIIAKTYPSFMSGSWGEQITILFDKDSVLVNSICDPDKRSSVVSMGRNTQNEKTLLERIKTVTNTQ